jgi:hypothetical protein
MSDQQYGIAIVVREHRADLLREVERDRLLQLTHGTPAAHSRRRSNDRRTTTDSSILNNLAGYATHLIRSMQPVRRPCRTDEPTS